MTMKNALKAAASGAASIAVIDGVLTQAPTLSAYPLARAVLRLSLAAAASEGARRAGASEPVADGLLAGPVIVTLLDLAIALIGRRRLDPPPVRAAGQLGEPWAPQPRYTYPVKQYGTLAR